MILMPDTTFELAQQALARAQQKIIASFVIRDEQEMTLSLRLGVVPFETEMTSASELLELAQKAVDKAPVNSV
jgi:hypothetical protein